LSESSTPFFLIIFFFFLGPFSLFFLISSVNLLLITARVKFNKKKAPINTIGMKYAITQDATAYSKAIILDVQPSKVTV